MKHQKLETTAEISKRMANVKLKRGNTEVLFARALWHKGYRYRLNYKRLPGSPDIAILKYHIAVFVDGEFWHGKDWNVKRERLKTNREYWIEKIEENIIRDKRVDEELEAKGWTPVHFWSKEILCSSENCVKAIDEIILAKIIGVVD